MRELMHNLRGDFLRLRKVQRASGLVKVSWCDYALLAFSLVFMAYLSNAVVSGKSPFFFLARIVLKPLHGIAHRSPRTL